MGVCGRRLSPCPRQKQSRSQARHQPPLSGVIDRALCVSAALSWRSSPADRSLRTTTSTPSGFGTTRAIRAKRTGRQDLVSPRSPCRRSVDRGGPRDVRRPFLALGQRDEDRRRGRQSPLSLQSERHRRPRTKRDLRRGREPRRKGGTVCRRRGPQPGGPQAAVRYGCRLGGDDRRARREPPGCSQNSISAIGSRSK